jgi:hypothetical protein
MLNPTAHVPTINVDVNNQKLKFSWKDEIGLKWVELETIPFEDVDTGADGSMHMASYGNFVAGWVVDQTPGADKSIGESWILFGWIYSDCFCIKGVWISNKAQNRGQWVATKVPGTGLNSVTVNFRNDEDPNFITK